MTCSLFIYLRVRTQGTRTQNPMKARGEQAVNKYGLTEKQEAYCQLRAQGVKQTDAYKEAYARPGTSDAACRAGAAKVERLAQIQARLAILREQAEAQALMDTATIQAKLTEIATDENQPVSAQLKAMDQLAKIQGAYETKVEVTARVTMDEREEAARRLMEAAFNALDLEDDEE